MLGTGAVITPSPTNIAAGETFFPAAKALTPVDDTIRVGIDLGNATEEKKTAVLSGALKLRDIGDVKIEVCRSPTDCVPATYSGPYFSQESYGIGFDATGPLLRHARFVGVKVYTDRPLEKATVRWSNYSQ